MAMMRRLFLALVLAAGLWSAARAVAADGGPLFVNLTTEDSHRANMAMMFSKNMLERGHPVAIWLNDKGVLLAARSQALRFAPQQKMLGELMAKGAQVLVCPFCAEHYGVAAGDVLEGARMGNPDLAESLLFGPGTAALSW